MNIISTEQRLLPQASLPVAARPAPESMADALGVNAVLKMIRRRIMLMLAVGAIVAALLLTRSMMATPVFQATALVAINARQERVLDNSESVLGDLPREAAAIDTEIEILRSPPLRTELVDALQLTRDPEWNWMLREPPAWKTFLTSLLSPVLRADAGQGEAVDPMTLVDEPWLRTAIAGSVGSALSIKRRGMTYVIEINARSKNPIRAQELANTFAEIYLASQGRAREEAAQRATSWLADRVEKLSEDVQRKEAAEQAFREQSGITSAEGKTLIEQQVTNVQTSVLQAQADLAEKQARYRQLRELLARGGSPESISDALQSAAILSLRQRETEIARRQSELENRYLPTHPLVQSIRIEREDIARQIEVEMERISVNLGQEVDVARTRLQTLQSQLDRVTAELQQENNKSIRLRELERESEASRRVYENYLERYENLVHQEQSFNTDAFLVARAEQGGYQIAPNFRVALVFALMAGTFLGIVAGAAAELLDRTIRSREEVETKIGYPAITAIPTISKSALRSVPRASRNPPSYLVEKPMSAYTEALRVLRTVIVHSHLGSASRVVAIASALPGEGKTTVAMSLARVAALSGQRVIVVDCDLRKQSINRFLDVKPEVGLIQALTGETTWQDALVRDQRSQADILPIAGSSFTSLDIFGSDSMELLLSELREAYEIVVLDCPPLFAVADARVVCSLADSVVIVAHMGKSALDAVRMAVDQVVSAGGKVAGVALNRVPTGGLGRLAYGDMGYSYEVRSYYSTA